MNKDSLLYNEMRTSVEQSWLSHLITLGFMLVFLCWCFCLFVLLFFVVVFCLFSLLTSTMDLKCPSLNSSVSCPINNNQGIGNCASLIFGITVPDRGRKHERSIDCFNQGLGPVAIEVCINCIKILPFKFEKALLLRGNTNEVVGSLGFGSNTFLIYSHSQRSTIHLM